MVKKKKVTPFNYPRESTTVTDGVRALVHLNQLLEKHLSVSVMIFSSRLHFFPKDPIKAPPNQTVLLPH